MRNLCFFQKIAQRGKNHLRRRNPTVAPYFLHETADPDRLIARKNPSHCVSNSTNSSSPVPLCKRRFEKCLCSCFLTLHRCYMHTCLVKSSQDGQELPLSSFHHFFHEKTTEEKTWHADRNIPNSS